ncbi:NUDIX hydrolase [soil metagenome]
MKAKTDPRPQDFPRPAVAVDIVVFTVDQSELRLLVVRRGEAPFRGELALPGGFLRVLGDGPSARDQGEDLDAAARRELHEETALDPSEVWLEQLGAFGRAGRDPRMRVVAVAYYALVRPDLVPKVRGGGDAAAALWVPFLELPKLAFDHEAIAHAAHARIVRDLDRTGLGFHLAPQPFTIPELRATWGAIGGKPLDPGNFRRRFGRMLEDGIVTAAPGKRRTGSKPATLYRSVVASRGS